MNPIFISLFLSLVRFLFWKHIFFFLRRIFQKTFVCYVVVSCVFPLCCFDIQIYTKNTDILNSIMRIYSRFGFRRRRNSRFVSKGSYFFFRNIL